MKGENVMVVGHANSLRGIAKIIDGEIICVINMRCCLYHIARPSNINIFPRNWR